MLIVCISDVYDEMSLSDGESEPGAILTNEDFANDCLLACGKLKSQKIMSLTIQSCKDIAKRLIESIVSLQNLAELSILNSSLYSNSLSELFCKGIHVSTLIIENCSLDDACARVIADHLSSISVLSLKSNHITSDGARAIFSESSSLVSVDLSNNLLDDAVINSICFDCPHLLLSKNKFSSNGLRLLLEAIQSHRLKSIDLSEMDFSNVQSSLSSIVESSCHLKMLYLRRCAITVFPAIPSDTKLRVLDLTGNSVREFRHPNSLTVIGDLLPVNSVGPIFESIERLSSQICSLLKYKAEIENSESMSDEFRNLGSSSQHLSSQILSLMKKLHSKPNVKKLSIYAGKVLDDESLSEFAHIDGPSFPLSKSISPLTKVAILSQFNRLVRVLGEKGLFLEKIDRSYFKICSKKLVLTDMNIIGKAPNPLAFSEFFNIIYSDEDIRLSMGVESLILSVLPTHGSSTYSVSRDPYHLICQFSPLKLCQLCENFQLKVEGEGAVDHGGVIRDVLSQFWEKAACDYFESSSVTLLPKECSVDFKSIGKIMFKSFIISVPISIPIHSIVFRFFLEQMPQTENEWIQELQKYDSLIAKNVQIDASEEEVIDRCRNILIGKRIEQMNKLKAGFILDQSFGSAIKSCVDWYDLRKKIVGEENWSGKELQNQIAFVGFSDYPNVVQFWVEEIGSFSHVDALMFVRLLTGLNGIPAGGFTSQGKKLIITKSTRFYSHTCSYELESPSYFSRSDLHEAISSAFTVLESDSAMNEWYTDG